MPGVIVPSVAILPGPMPSIMLVTVNVDPDTDPKKFAPLTGDEPDPTHNCIFSPDAPQVHSPEAMTKMIPFGPAVTLQVPRSAKAVVLVTVVSKLPHICVLMFCADAGDVAVKQDRTNNIANNRFTAPFLQSLVALLAQMR